MNEDCIKALIVDEIVNIAPDVDSKHIDPDEDLRDALDIDSMDFLNIVTALDAKFGVAIPESDYAEVSTLNAVARYIAARTPD